MLKKIVVLFLLLCTFGAVLYGDSKELVFILGAKTGFSVEQQEKIVKLYQEAEKEGLQPGIIHSLITEGISKKVAYDKLYPVILEKLDKIKWIKNFCKDSNRSDLKIPYHVKTTEKLLLVLNNNRGPEDIVYFHKLWSKHKIKTKDFLNTLGEISRLNVRMRDREQLKKMLADMDSSGKTYRYMHRIVNMLTRTRSEHMEEACKLIREMVRENRNFFELEDELRLRNLQQNGRRSMVYSSEDEKKEKLRKKEMKQKK